jgi:murein DD-endopeptidase MepM/ murein hydrolase activator NlpD
MIKKWITLLVLCTFLLGLPADPAAAGLEEGAFYPCCTVHNILTDGKIISYKIKKGDTLWDISKKNNVDLKTIMVINSLNENSILNVGQTLEIPYSRSRMHIVRKGETMWSIALRYNTSVQNIRKSNPNKIPANLSIGDKLIIPDSTYTAAVFTEESSRGGMLLSSMIFSWPIIGMITSHYGWRKTGFHHGLDIAAGIGESIKAAASGYVSFAGYKPVYGNTVIINHPGGKQTVYAHAQKIYVKKNQYVTKGEILATVGVTGNTTGPHLHFEIREGKQTYDPLKYLR